jgi:general secretion pathway protein D
MRRRPLRWPLRPRGGGSGGAGEETPINIIPQPRTGRIFLMGRPVDIVFVEGLIADFDTPSSKRNFLRRKLRYLPVSEFIVVAADALERTLGDQARTGGSSGTRRSTSSSGSSSASVGRSTRGSQASTGRNTGTGSETRAGLMQQEFQTAPDSLLVGKTLLVGDNISNSIVVNGPPHHIEIVDELIRELDQASEQVAITAVFGKYDLGDGRSFGVDFAALFRGGGAEPFRGGLQNRNGVPSVVDPTTLTDFSTLLGASNAASAGFSLYSLIGDDFALFVNALESNDNFTALARPTVFTTNNGTARISSGSRIAVPTSTFQGGVSSGFSTNVEFRDIVLELEVRPLVNSEDEVTLEISLVRDAIGENRVIQGFGNVPDIDTEEIATTVTVPNRSTIVLGGLIQEAETESRSGVPILSSIPGVGRIFGSTTTDVQRDELVILIHPTIISSQGQLNAYQRAFDGKNNISGRARDSVEGALLPPQGSYVPDAGKAPSYAPPPPAAAPRAVPVEEPADFSDGGQRRSRGVVTSPMHRSLLNR